MGYLRTAATLFPGAARATSESRAAWRGNGLLRERGMLQGPANRRRRDRSRPRQCTLRVREARDACHYCSEKAQSSQSDQDQLGILSASQSEQAQTRLGRMGGEDATAKTGRRNIDHQHALLDSQQFIDDHSLSNCRDESRQYHKRKDDAPSTTSAHSKCSQLAVHDAITDLHDDDLDDALPDASVHDNWPVPRRRRDWMSRDRTVRLRSPMTGACIEKYHYCRNL